MAIQQYIVTLNATGGTGLAVTPTATSSTHPVISDRKIYPWDNATVTVQNIDAAATVYLGNSSSVSATSYGVSLPFGSSITFDTLSPTETIYAVSSAASTKVSVLAVVR
jgi:hypothetical protein